MRQRKAAFATVVLSVVLLVVATVCLIVDKPHPQRPDGTPTPTGHTHVALRRPSKTLRMEVSKKKLAAVNVRANRFASKVQEPDGNDKGFHWRNDKPVHNIFGKTKVYKWHRGRERRHVSKVYKQLYPTERTKWGHFTKPSKPDADETRAAKLKNEWSAVHALVHPASRTAPKAAIKPAVRKVQHEVVTKKAKPPAHHGPSSTLVYNKMYPKISTKWGGFHKPHEHNKDLAADNPTEVEMKNEWNTLHHVAQQSKHIESSQDIYKQLYPDLKAHRWGHADQHSGT